MDGYDVKMSVNNVKSIPEELKKYLYKEIAKEKK